MCWFAHRFPCLSSSWESLHCAGFFDQRLYYCYSLVLIPAAYVRGVLSAVAVAKHPFFHKGCVLMQRLLWIPLEQFLNADASVWGTQFLIAAQQQQLINNKNNGNQHARQRRADNPLQWINLQGCSLPLARGTRMNLSAIIFGGFSGANMQKICSFILNNTILKHILHSYTNSYIQVSQWRICFNLHNIL